MMNKKLLLSSAGAGGSQVCDLCHHHKPSFYCSSDSAFLCSQCDSQVHSANFLVARHIRLPLLCKPSSTSSSSSTTNITHHHHTPTPKANNNKKSFLLLDTTITIISDWKTRDVLVNWCTKLGLGVSADVILEVAKHAFEVSWGVLVWPYRLGLAASLWLGVITTCCTKKNNNKKKIRMLLKRLEEISGIPANSIMLAQSKLVKIMKHHHHHLEEGWDES